MRRYVEGSFNFNRSNMSDPSYILHIYMIDFLRGGQSYMVWCAGGERH
jgi:hypothetical protein